MLSVFSRCFVRTFFKDFTFLLWPCHLSCHHRLRRRAADSPAERKSPKLSKKISIWHFQSVTLRLQETFSPWYWIKDTPKFVQVETRIDLNQHNGRPDFLTCKSCSKSETKFESSLQKFPVFNSVENSRKAAYFTCRSEWLQYSTISAKNTKITNRTTHHFCLSSTSAVSVSQKSSALRRCRHRHQNLPPRHWTDGDDESSFEQK